MSKDNCGMTGEQVAELVARLRDTRRGFTSLHDDAMEAADWLEVVPAMEAALRDMVAVHHDGRAEHWCVQPHCTVCKAVASAESVLSHFPTTPANAVQEVEQ